MLRNSTDAHADKKAIYTFAALRTLATLLQAVGERLQGRHAGEAAASGDGSQGAD